MKISDIKPIPKYIIKKIKRLDKEKNPTPNGNKRFYSYLTVWNKELVRVTVAVRHRYKTWLCKQVAIHGLNTPHCLVKDMDYYTIAGYVVGWFDEGITNEPKCYEGDWWPYDGKYFNPFAPTVNVDFALKMPKFKYSAVDLYTGDDALKYLKLYEKYPQMEYITKLGLSYIVTSKQILKLASTSKAFRKWLGRNSQELKTNCYYVSTIMQAFKKNKPLKEIQDYESAKKSLVRDYHYTRIKGLFKGDISNLIDYLANKNIRLSLYIDYINACQELGLNITEIKHRYPHDFMRWHDIRIDENNTRKALEDAKQQKELYEKFAIISNKFLSLERKKNENYVVIIAKTPADLKREGLLLHHCVGGSSYSQKFIHEESLIFFVRPINETETPFITLEYSIRKKQILQCYGDHNQTPEPKVMNFIKKKWLPYANKQLNQLVA